MNYLGQFHFFYSLTGRFLLISKTSDFKNNIIYICLLAPSFYVKQQLHVKENCHRFVEMLQ